jgi:ABC-type lipoprotein release transport system permease subunit
MALPLSYNARNVFQRPVSTFTTAIGIGLTVAILIGALALAAGFRASLVSTGLEENALVLRKGADSEISSVLSREVASILRSHPSVASGPDGQPLASTELVIVVNKPRLGQKGSSNLTVRGIDAHGVAVRGKVKVIEGAMFTPGTDEIMVGKRAAARFANCGIGDRVHLQQRDFKVVGLFAAGGSAYESEIWGDAAVLGPALDRDGFQTVVYRMKDPSQFPALKKELEADPRLQVQVQREQQFYADQSQMFTGLITGVGTFITLIMAVGAIFGAMNTMFAAVGSRRREIATLLVLGFSPWSIMSSFVVESVLLAMVGGLIGCLLALPINGITTSTTNFQSFSEMAFAFQVTPAVLLQGFLFSVFLGVVGGILPAWRASRQTLATGLRGA